MQYKYIPNINKDHQIKNPKWRHLAHVCDVEI